MQQNHLKQLDEEIENYPKHHFKRKRSVFPRKKQIDFDIKCDENFSKYTFIVSMKKEVTEILERCLKFPESVISNFSMHFTEKNSEENKLRKPRTKKLYKILDDKVKQMKYKLFANSYLIFPFFLSTHKENDINYLFPYIDSGKYTTFVDVFFNKGNFYFFLCLENNIINIPSLPTLAFYRSIQKGQGSKICSYIESIPQTNIKKNYEAAKDALNELLPQYEVNLENDKALVLVILPNSPSNRNLFKNYIYNYEQYNNDNNDYSLSRSLNPKN
jgi:hypothetical protein